jgi:hypothetical protein
MVLHRDHRTGDTGNMTYGGVPAGRRKKAFVRIDVEVRFNDDGILDLKDQAIEALDANEFEILFAEVIGEVYEADG